MTSIEVKYEKIFEAAKEESELILSLKDIALGSDKNSAPYYYGVFDFEEGYVDLYRSMSSNFVKTDDRVWISLDALTSSHAFAEALKSDTFKSLVQAYDDLDDAENSSDWSLAKCDFSDNLGRFVGVEDADGVAAAIFEEWDFSHTDEENSGWIVTYISDLTDNHVHVECTVEEAFEALQLLIANSLEEAA
ncbi:hypothetical protein G3A39_38430 [Paraburkholderia aspalathi]|nr:hypothetical protein [Paraburkholderia aspalathi]